MASYTEEVVIEAPRNIVFEVFADREGSNDLLPIGVKLKRPGNTERQGVGAVYTVGLGPVGVQEETTALVPGERFEYRVVGASPFKSHTGTVEFADDPRGTKVRYTMDSDPRLPIPAAVITPVLKQMIGTLLKATGKEAVKRANG